MKILLRTGLAALGMACLPAIAAPNVAQVRMFCLSIRFEKAVDSLSGLYTLALFSGGDSTQPNGELYAGPQVHESGFIMEAAEFLEPLVGDLFLVAPENIDADANGIPDLYEVNRPLPSTTTAGEFYSFIDQGTVSARWQRPAGSRLGTCTLTFTGDAFGQLPGFSHTIEVTEYAGTLAYTPTTNNVPVQFDLTQVDNPERAIAGPLLLSRNPENPQNLLSTTDVAWTNAQDQVLINGYFDIEPPNAIQTDYFGITAFADGDPTTPEMDYELFYVGIDDPNDADGDGTPDLTDPPVATPPIPPSLTIARAGDILNLTLTGEAGRSYQLDTLSNLSQTNWTTITNLTLSTSNGVVSLPIPTDTTTFWRAQVR